MIEKTIYLDGIDPIYLFGANNLLLDKIKENFPKLKIIGRGHEVKAFGAKKDIDSFETKIELFINFYQRYNKLTENDISELMIEQQAKPHATHKTDDQILLYGNHGKIIKARSENQQKLVNDSEFNDLLFAIGPAGTGKTYTAIALAVRALKNNEVRKIILTRPAVEAGEQLGFLPGDLKEKLDPYLQPLYDALGDMIPPKKLATYLEEKTIEIAPLAFMRGRTLGNAYVILDEAQNTTTNQIKMFLTRMGENAHFIVTGDLTQIDLPRNKKSGLLEALKILVNIKGISTIYFDKNDIIRHKLVINIVDAYNNIKENDNI